MKNSEQRIKVNEKVLIFCLFVLCTLHTLMALIAAPRLARSQFLFACTQCTGKANDSKYGWTSAEGMEIIKIPCERWFHENWVSLKTCARIVARFSVKSLYFAFFPFLQHRTFWLASLIFSPSIHLHHFIILHSVLDYPGALWTKKEKRIRGYSCYLRQHAPIQQCQVTYLVRRTEHYKIWTRQTRKDGNFLPEILIFNMYLMEIK